MGNHYYLACKTCKQITHFGKLREIPDDHQITGVDHEIIKFYANGGGYLEPNEEELALIIEEFSDKFNRATEELYCECLKEAIHKVLGNKRPPRKVNVLLTCKKCKAYCGRQALERSLYIDLIRKPDTYMNELPIRCICGEKDYTIKKESD